MTTEQFQEKSHPAFPYVSRLSAIRSADRSTVIDDNHITQEAVSCP